MFPNVDGSNARAYSRPNIVRKRYYKLKSANESFPKYRVLNFSRNVSLDLVLYPLFDLMKFVNVIFSDKRCIKPY